MARDKRRQYRALIALNAFLLLVLAAMTFSQYATAQNQSTRGRGDYAMVEGNVQGVVSSVVYIIDSRNEELAAYMWDQSKNLLVPLGYRDLTNDMNRARGGGR